MVKFGKTELEKERFHAVKKSTKIWDINIDM